MGSSSKLQWNSSGERQSRTGPHGHIININKSEKVTAALELRYILYIYIYIYIYIEHSPN